MRRTGRRPHKIRLQIELLNSRRAAAYDPLIRIDMLPLLFTCVLIGARLESDSSAAYTCACVGGARRYTICDLLVILLDLAHQLIDLRYRILGACDCALVTVCCTVWAALLILAGESWAFSITAFCEAVALGDGARVEKLCQQLGERT